MNLEQLLKNVEAATKGSLELDSEFARAFPISPPNLTNSIDAVVRLIEAELPGWWWSCGYCSLSNDASLYVPGSSSLPYARATMAPDFRTGPIAMQMLDDPKWGKLFDKGFHRDRRGGTVPLAMLAAFLVAKINLTNFQKEKTGSAGEVSS